MMEQRRRERYYRFATQQENRFDIRDPYSRDRDRILFSSAFRRLSGITQVIQPNGRYARHNRLTHSLEVAQIARSIAAHILQDNPRHLVNSYGGLDISVVEAAALAHDIGHPPFGHVSEEVLQSEIDLDDNFEGNAQSFRVITRLSSRFNEMEGLNLTRATLSAVSKYPWLRDTNAAADDPKWKKWNAYKTEEELFIWSREHLPEHLRERKTLEAEIMDWSDDIAYAVHDLEDFYRAGMIPLEQLSRYRKHGSREFENCVTSFYSHKSAKPFLNMFNLEKVIELGSDLLDSLGCANYRGTRNDRVVIRQFTSGLVNKYIGNTRLESHLDTALKHGMLSIDNEIKLEVALLKWLTVFYVIGSPALAAQRFGQKALISSITATLLQTLSPKPNADSLDHSILEAFHLEILDELKSDYPDQQQRVVADYICSLTEFQALSLGRIISGSEPFDSLRGVIS